jgi:hypothetical protein
MRKMESNPYVPVVSEDQSYEVSRKFLIKFLYCLIWFKLDCLAFAIKTVAINDNKTMYLCGELAKGLTMEISDTVVLSK